jgi:hypothetical protein
LTRNDKRIETYLIASLVKVRRDLRKIVHHKLYFRFS